MFTNQNNISLNNYFMGLALKQARKNLGNTGENPSVGCVIVKNGVVVSAEHTSFKGRPHAEHNAILKSNINIKQGILYVTLEPCAHYGKTTPCVKKIIKKRIKKVFFGINDPDTRTFDKSTILLKKRNIFVNKGTLKKDITNFYEDYLNFKKNLMPYVTCKIALTKDFYTINTKNRWITNIYSRSRVHLLRSYSDCLITSSSTINVDNPSLTCRINGLNKRSPTRIIFDKNLKIKLKAKVLRDAKKIKTMIFYNKMSMKKIQILEKMNVKTFKISLDKYGNLDLVKSLIKIRKLGFSRAFVEAGIKLTSSFLRKKLVNDFKIFISNKSAKKNGKGNFKKYYYYYCKNKKSSIEKVNLLGEKFISYKLS